MKQILFRGKRIDNNEWVYGFYFERLTDSIKHCYIKYETWDEGFVTYEVIPETVGQFTGICDKNGNKIFEGDIVHFYDTEWTAGGIATVDFESGKWKINGHYTAKLSSMVWLDLYQTGFEYEVIGNIYDNPRLLEDIE